MERRIGLPDNVFVNENPVNRTGRRGTTDEGFGANPSGREVWSIRSATWEAYKDGGARPTDRHHSCGIGSAEGVSLMWAARALFIALPDSNPYEVQSRDFTRRRVPEISGAGQDGLGEAG